MRLEKIELTNFRNYDKYKIDNLKDVNIIIGDNGIGKTTILESIYVCSLARSFKNNDESVMLKNDKDFFKIKINIEDNNKKKNLEYLYTSKGKKTKINNNLKRKISEFISQYKVIIFSPDELKLVKDSPNTRRNYLNVSLSQINKNYLKVLNNYNTLIKNKNEYLKKMYINSNSDVMYLDLLDQKIASLGKEICDIRNEYIEKINKYIQKIFKKYKKNDTLYIKYESVFLGKNEEEIIKLLMKNRKKEMELGQTSTGIHRDDFDFIYNDTSARDYASQGLQKIILLSLKMSELEILINDYYEEPILLLDDLFSELDIDNRNSVLNNLNTKIQVFITTTDINNVKKSLINKALVIDLGGKNGR